MVEREVRGGIGVGGMGEIGFEVEKVLFRAKDWISKVAKLEIKKKEKESGGGFV